MLGAICGDVLGSSYEFEEKKYEDISKIKLMLETDTVTDDSAMTLAVADWILHDIEKAYLDDEKLKRMLAEKFVWYAFKVFAGQSLGFGERFWEWLCCVDLLWEFEPINSYGNGAGMRVSPVGWAFDTLEETLRFAKLSADVTHNHPEGEKGAMCIAAAIFLARIGKSKEEIRSYLYEKFEYPQLLQDVSTLRATCAWSEICQDTVPMAVVAFLESTDYRSAVTLAISYGSDSDTIADMAGAIAEAYYRYIPEDIVEFCKAKLPKKALLQCEAFAEKFQK